LALHCKGISPLNLSEQFSLSDWLAFCSGCYPELMPQRGELRPVKRCGTVLLHGMTHEAILHEFLSVPLCACVDI